MGDIVPIVDGGPTDGRSPSLRGNGDRRDGPLRAQVDLGWRAPRLFRGPKRLGSVGFSNTEKTMYTGSNSIFSDADEME